MLNMHADYTLVVNLRTVVSMTCTRTGLTRLPSKLATLAVCLVVGSCTTNHTDERDTTKIDIHAIHVSPVVHDTLGSVQLKKIRFIYDTFSEVQPGTLESTITDFKRDQNPDSEIAIWLNMANAYEKFIQKRDNGLDLASKKEAYKLILLRSEMPVKEAVAELKPKLLSAGDVSDILGGYDQAPEPIKVYSPH